MLTRETARVVVVASKRVWGTRFAAAQFRATAVQAPLVRQLTETVPCQTQVP
jgi:hypothetical protein